MTFCSNDTFIITMAIFIAFDIALAAGDFVEKFQKYACTFVVKSVTFFCRNNNFDIFIIAAAAVVANTFCANNIFIQLIAVIIYLFLPISRHCF